MVKVRVPCFSFSLFDNRMGREGNEMITTCLGSAALGGAGWGVNYGIESDFTLHFSERLD